MPEIVKAEALALGNLYACLDGCQPQMVGNKNGWRNRNAAICLKREKYKVCFPSIWRLHVPCLEELREGRMQLAQGGPLRIRQGKILGALFLCEAWTPVE